jgi:Ser/Thr protein kinase RdoA (MazF antagonist)
MPALAGSAANEISTTLRDLPYDLSVFLWAKVPFGRELIATLDAFVDGYRALRPIAPNDFEAAHGFVIVRHIWVMGEHESRAQEWNRSVGSRAKSILLKRTRPG